MRNRKPVVAIEKNTIDRKPVLQKHTWKKNQQTGKISLQQKTKIAL